MQGWNNIFFSGSRLWANHLKFIQILQFSVPYFTMILQKEPSVVQAAILCVLLFRCTLLFGIFSAMMSSLPGYRKAYHFNVCLLL